MNILQKIIAEKHLEVAKNKVQVPVKILEQQNGFSKPTISISKSLTTNEFGIIAEFKRKSPSKGIINGSSTVDSTVIGYENAGVSAVSVLTDLPFFGGENKDLKNARENTSLPILRKDFIIDEYQLIEAKAIGADVILLIAAVLTPTQTRELAAMAHSIGLEVLMEVNSKVELDTHLCEHLDLVGVNNRSLNDFSLNVNLSFELAEYIPNQFIKVAESAIAGPQTVVDLKKVGFKGFLIGESFMKASNPHEACAEFINTLKALSAK